MAELKEVVDHLAFDTNALQSYLRTHTGLQTEQFSILQYEGGQSNPTYLLNLDDEKYVLRRRPPGKLLPSAHAVEREFRIMKALKESSVPVPEMVTLCEDDSVIGTAFYVMKHVDGRVLEPADLDAVTPSDVTKMFENMIRTLAALHQVDYEKIGLADYGKTDDYVARQISRWTKQYHASQTQTIEAMDNLIETLPKIIPPSGPATIIHGDYSIRNLIFAPESSDVCAVLDWELSTLGDPLSDLAYFCLIYEMPYPSGLAGRDLKAMGVPDSKELRDLYFRLTGQAPPSEEDWNFYIAFNLFRLSAILHGVRARAIQGNASSDRGLSFGQVAIDLATLGWSKITNKTNPPNWHALDTKKPFMRPE